jgi:hypothetical protein
MLPVRRIQYAPLLVATLMFLSCDDSPTENEEPQVPAALDIVSGDEQQDTVGTELNNPLVVRVENANGIPIAGQLVNFRVTAGGGSVFAGSGITNALGIVQDRWTLGTSTADTQRVEARAVDPNTGARIVFATFKATPLPGPGHSLVKTGGDEQQGTVGQSLAQPLVVRLTDQFANPIPGATVGWNVITGGGTLAASSSITNASGHASIGWTLGNAPGAHQVSATRTGLPSVTFVGHANVGAPSGMTIVGGNGQTGVVGGTLPQALVVRLTDALGNPIPSTTVTFTVASGGGSVTSSSATTDAAGEARTSWTLGGAVGAQAVTASAGSATAGFSATATVGPPATIAKVGGDGQSASIGQPLGQPLVVRVKDQFGNDVPGAAVTWTVIAGGGTTTPPNGSTDAAGQASTQWTLGPVGGAHSVRADVGDNLTTTFTANAVAPGGSSLVVHHGSEQWGRVGMPLQSLLVVRLLNSAGQPLVGVDVTWTPSAGTVNPTSSATDADGLASTRWTLGTSVETTTVVASATGASSATFSAHVRPGAVCRLAVFGNGQTGVINQPLAQPLTIRPTDRYGNPTGPMTVNPSGQPGNNSGSLSGELRADSSGVSEPVTWTLGSTVGQQIKTFSWIPGDNFCTGGGVMRDVIFATGVAEP